MITSGSANAGHGAWGERAATGAIVRTFFTPARLAREPPATAFWGVLERRSLLKMRAARASFFLRSRPYSSVSVGEVVVFRIYIVEWDIPSWINFWKSAPASAFLAAMMSSDRGEASKGSKLGKGLDSQRGARRLRRNV